MALARLVLLLLCLAVAGTASACIPPPAIIQPLSLSSAPVPAARREKVDWRERGAVTPAKSQGHLDSCWAFAGIGAVEGLHKIKMGQLMNLSSQQVCDCAPKAGSNTRFKAFDWILILLHGGVASEAAYPYTVRRDEPCRAEPIAASITGYKRISSESELLQAVARQPVAVRMKLDAAHFRDHHGGIFKGPCGKDVHAMLVVGYAETANGKKYWIVKNSFGHHWCYQGFFYVKRGARTAGGVCGIAENAGYPI